MNTVTVRIANGKNFRKGLSYAKKFGGKYNPQDKTWDIPTHRNGVYNNALNNPQAYYLVPVGNMDKSHDHNCPARFGSAACECK